MTHGIITDGIADGETLGTTIHGDTIIGIMTRGIIHGDTTHGITTRGDMTRGTMIHGDMILGTTTHGMALTGTEDMSDLSDRAHRSRDYLRTETITTDRDGAPRQTATEK